MDTANFIQHQTSVFLQDTTSEKREDCAYFKSNDTVELHEIGLCSTISGTARAYIRISEFTKGEVMLMQSVMIKAGSKLKYNFYKLEKPVKILKHHFYKIEIEVFGGAIYTYTEALQHSAHRDFVIEFIRPSKKPVSSLGDLNTEASSLQSLEENPAPKSVKKFAKNGSRRKAKSLNALECEMEKSSAKSKAVLSKRFPIQIERSSTNKTKYSKTSERLHLVTGFVFKRTFNLTFCNSR